MLLKIGYIGLTILMIIIITVMGKEVIDKTVADKHARTKKLLFLIGGLIIWQVYQLAIGASGILTDFSFPPRFMLLLVLPAFVFTGIFLRKNRNKAWVMEVPESWLSYVQSFRILVETLFVYSVAAGVLHPIVTIEGCNYDMIFGASAIVIWLLAYKLNILSRKIVLLWNYLGLAVLASVIFLFVSSVYFPQLYGLSEMMPKAFATAPFVLVAGFLMPSAVFIHVLSIIQLSKKINSNNYEK